MLQIVDQSACNHAPTFLQNGAEPKEADCIPVFSSDLIYRIMRKRNQSTKKPIWKLHLMKYSPMFGRLANSTNSLTLNGSHNFMSKSECWCNICIKLTLISYGRKLYYCITREERNCHRMVYEYELYIIAAVGLEIRIVRRFFNYIFIFNINQNNKNWRRAEIEIDQKHFEETSTRWSVSHILHHYYKLMKLQ